MSTEIKGKIYDIQPFSVQDGPGIRTTVFLKGCPLRCPWCHSPESQMFKPELCQITMRCQGTERCGRCLDACPHRSISVGKQENSSSGELRSYPQINRQTCTDCGECTKKCHFKSLYICGEDLSVDSVFARVKSDIPFYKDSGGGVTVSGGEPLCQPRFTIAFLRKLKDAEIHTALDTTGFVSSEIIAEAVPHTDLFLYDLKHMKSDAHFDMVAVPNEQILNNAKLISSLGGKMQIRVPVITGFNDSAENILNLGRFCKELGGAVEMLQLLPFHSLGDSKYSRIGKESEVFKCETPTKAHMESLKTILEGFGLPVSIH